MVSFPYKNIYSLQNFASALAVTLLSSLLRRVELVVARLLHHLRVARPLDAFFFGLSVSFRAEVGAALALRFLLVIIYLFSLVVNLSSGETQHALVVSR